MTVRRHSDERPADVTTAGIRRPTERIPEFGALPPEINSAMLYSGAGAQPLIAAASAWDALAAELESYTAACSSVLSHLQRDAWLGPTSLAMADAVTPYLVWVAATAEKVAEAANKARAAAAAYEAALQAMVPPEVIAANRAHVETLVRSNVFGQNTPAIAATETAYAEMWAQDATAMYEYAASSLEAVSLTPFGYPPTIACAARYSAEHTAEPESSPPDSSRISSYSDRPQQRESLLGNAFGDLNTVLVVPLQLVFSLAETAFDTGNYAYAVKAGCAPRDAAGAQPTIASQSVGGPSTLPAPQGPHGPRFTDGHSTKNAGGLAVPPGWATAAQPPVAGHDATQAERRRPPGSSGANVATQAVVPASAASPRSPAVGRRRGNVAFRKRDRRFKMPKPAVGG